MRGKAVFCALVALLITGSAFGSEKRHETDISNSWCDIAGGEPERRTLSGDRIDCWIPDEFASGVAIEHDWSGKWYESVGQSLSYRYQMENETGESVIAGIVIIREPDVSDNLWDKRMRELNRVRENLAWQSVYIRLSCIEQDLTVIPCGNENR